MKELRKTKFPKIIVTATLLFSSLSFFGCSKKETSTNSDKEYYSRQILDLQAQLDTLQQNFDELSTMYVLSNASKDANADELNAEIIELNELLSAINAQITALTNEIIQLQDANALTEAELQQKIDQLNELQNYASQLQGKINSLNAQIDSLNQQIEQFQYGKVTFNTDGGSNIPDLNVPRNGLIKKPNNPTKKGYTFICWKYGEGDSAYVWDFDNDVVKGDMTLNAIWEANRYVVKFNTHGGNPASIPDIEIVYDTQFTLPVVNKADYTLHRWKYGNTEVKSGPWKIDSNVTLECEWALTIATVTYDYNFIGYPSTYPLTSTVKYGSNYTLFVPSRKGYTFLGWKIGTRTISDFGVWKELDNVTLVAAWSSDSYVITLDPVEENTYDGSLTFNVSYDYEFKLPVCRGINESMPFAGWFLGDERFTDEEGNSIGKWTMTEGATLTAKYFHVIDDVDDFKNIKFNPYWKYGLVKDVDFNNFEIEPVESFEGILIGLGHSIKRARFISDNLDVGLFKTIHNATFEDILFTNCSLDITGEAENEEYNIGILAANSIGTNTFNNVTFSSNTISLSIPDSNFNVGCLVGKAESLILNDVCMTSNTFNVEGTNKSLALGGVAGNIENLTLNTCSLGINSIYLNSASDSLVGNVAGTCSSLLLNSVSMSTNTIDVDALDCNILLGTVIGSGGSVTLEDCTFNSNNVFALSNSKAINAGEIGGSVTELLMNDYDSSGLNMDIKSNLGKVIVGGATGLTQNIELSNSVVNGSIQGWSNEGSVNAGGFIGYCPDKITANDCINKAHVVSNSFGGTNTSTHQKYEGISGGIIGLAKNIDLHNCFNDGIVEENSIMHELSYAGGIVGKITARPTIYNCATRAAGKVIGRTYGGGVFGCNDSNLQFDLTSIYNEGRIEDAGESGNLGGLIGLSKTSSIRLINVYNVGEIVSTSGYAGGLVGETTSSVTFNESFNEGTVRATDGIAGGLVGLSVNSIVSNCYSVGLVEAKHFAGGIIGENTVSNPSISYSFVGGTVKVTDNSTDGKVGGFIGKNISSSIASSFVFATLIGINGHVNSFVGAHNGTPYTGTKVISAATLKDLSGNEIDDGVEKKSLESITPTYVKNTLFFSSDVWDLEFDLTNNTYPKLKAFIY